MTVECQMKSSERAHFITQIQAYPYWPSSQQPLKMKLDSSSFELGYQ